MADDVFRTRQFVRITENGPKTYHFTEPRWVFACGRCPYQYPFDGEEQAEAQREWHNRTVHVAELVDINWNDYMGPAADLMKALANNASEESLRALRTELGACEYHERIGRHG